MLALKFKNLGVFLYRKGLRPNLGRGKEITMEETKNGYYIIKSEVEMRLACVEPMYDTAPSVASHYFKRREELKVNTLLHIQQSLVEEDDDEKYHDYVVIDGRSYDAGGISLYGSSYMVLNIKDIQDNSIAITEEEYISLEEDVEKIQSTWWQIRESGFWEYVGPDNEVKVDYDASEKKIADYQEIFAHAVPIMKRDIENLSKMISDYENELNGIISKYLTNGEVLTESGIEKYKEFMNCPVDLWEEHMNKLTELNKDNYENKEKKINELAEYIKDLESAMMGLMDKDFQIGYSAIRNEELESYQVIFSEYIPKIKDGIMDLSKMIIDYGYLTRRAHSTNWFYNEYKDVIEFPVEVLAERLGEIKVITKINDIQKTKMTDFIEKISPQNSVHYKYAALCNERSGKQNTALSVMQKAKEFVEVQKSNYKSEFKKCLKQFDIRGTILCLRELNHLNNRDKEIDKIMFSPELHKLDTELVKLDLIKSDIWITHLSKTINTSRNSVRENLNQKVNARSINKDSASKNKRVPEL